MIRPYATIDIPTVRKIFRKNVPTYFAPAEEKDLIKYLQEEREDYYVLEAQDIIVGCGGINYLPSEQTAIISWDFFDPDFQGMGYGKRLLHFRLDKIKNDPSIKKIVVRTSQLTHRFYAKSGFELKRTEDNFWADGLHLYYMEQSAE